MNFVLFFQPPIGVSASVIDGRFRAVRAFYSIDHCATPVLSNTNIVHGRSEGTRGRTKIDDVSRDLQMAYIA